MLPQAMGCLTSVEPTTGIVAATDHNHHEHSATNVVLAEGLPRTFYAEPIGGRFAAEVLCKSCLINVVPPRRWGSGTARVPALPNRDQHA